MEKRSTRPHAQARKRSDEPPSGTFRHPLLRRREVVTCAEYGHPRWALLIRVWLGTFGIVVAALLRAAPEHDPTG